MSFESIDREIQFVKQISGDMCLYACMEMLLKDCGIDEWTQQRLIDYQKRNYIVTLVIGELVKTVNGLSLGVMVHYYNDNKSTTPRITIDDIKRHIQNKKPVYVNLYKVHHTLNPMGHSYIVYGCDGDKDNIYLINPDGTNESHKETMKIPEFIQQWCNNYDYIELFSIEKI